MTDALSISSRALPPTTRALAFRGTESMSALYCFDIHLVVEDPAFDIAPALGLDATLTIQQSDAPAFQFHGVFSSIESVAELPAGTVYRATLVPRLWQLTLTRHSRVFVSETAPAIIETLLREAGLGAYDYAMNLGASYPTLDHVCQYRESNFAFITRRMEREGIYFFFEQGQDRERLIIADDAGVHQALASAPVRYVASLGSRGSSDVGFRSFTSRHTAISSVVHLSGKDYLRPALDLFGRANASDGTEELHLHDESFATPAEGQRLARIRAQELKAQQLVFRGIGNCLFLRPGYTFTLEGHPRQNIDGEYLATDLEHTGAQADQSVDPKALGLEDDLQEGYQVAVVAIPKSVQFRPQQRTPAPRIYGTEPAVVDGPEDTDYAQLDEHGRYLVKIQFDESSARDGKASMRVRMMQPHGGSPENFHFPLRKGTEVMLTFEGGDPDRPVVAGVVPNMFNPTGVTSKNATKNIIHTGGGNRIVIEDQEGKQYIHIATPHKGTYMHMGSPFNPQYNKITNTAGTSLSFTESISTSVTGADAQTLVEDARMTIIGRSRIAGGDPLGTEITKLVGGDFITRFQQTALDRLWNEASQLLSTDAPPAATAMKNALKQLGATTPDAGQVAVFVFQLQASISLMISDLHTIVADATAALNTTAVNDANSLLDALAPLQADMTTAVGYVTAGDSASLALLKTMLTNDSTVLGVAANSSATPPVTASGLFASMTTLLADVEPPHAMPIAPSPNIAATFINLQHHDASIDTTANGVTVEENDSTAMDGAPTSPPPLHPGSDVKIVGGDNVTMVAHDARSHVTGTSYGLVLNGQASVVRNAQQSKVFAVDKSGPSPSPTLLTPSSTPTASTPGAFIPLSFPLPPPLSPPWLETLGTAQRSEVYGNTFSWIDGTTTSTVTGGTQVMVLARGRSRPLWPTFGIAPWTPPANRPGFLANWGGVVDAPPLTTPTPLNTESIAQTSEIFGDQFAFIDGDQTAKITGHKTTTVEGGQETIITGGQTTYADSQTTHVDNQVAFIGNSVKTAIASEDFTWALKLAVNTGAAITLSAISASLSILKFEMHAFEITNKSFDLGNRTLKITNGVLQIVA